MSLAKPWHKHKFSPMVLTPRSCKVCGQGEDNESHRVVGERTGIMVNALGRPNMEVFSAQPKFSAQRPSLLADLARDAGAPQATSANGRALSGGSPSAGGSSTETREDGHSGREVPSAPRVDEDEELPLSTNEDTMLDAAMHMKPVCTCRQGLVNVNCPVHKVRFEQ